MMKLTRGDRLRNAERARAAALRGKCIEDPTYIVQHRTVMGWLRARWFYTNSKGRIDGRYRKVRHEAL